VAAFTLRKGSTHY